MKLVRYALLVLVCLTILYGSWLMLCLSYPYLSFDKHTDFLMTKQLIYHIKTWRISFYIHVFVSTGVLIAGLFQFSTYLIKYKPALHRFLGKTYVFVILFFSGPSGLIMSYYANGGVWAKTSFIILSLLWLISTAYGWYYAVARKWQLHLNMMLRSYFLTLSALTLRTYAYLIVFFNIPLQPKMAYILIAWLSWSLNLLVAEIIIRRRWANRVVSFQMA
ncbi:putative membrane protein (DUF2306) [Solitalea canadensis DSM 3403]|uniref:Putative membrane protein (DUF2306) n=2 Tax=Solitalea canadensis TaxID=995 RepID=H8KT28_SOLCM|nr:putative membrane protein (DUF2306) [Solitalea canadensis DSM 3403]